MIIFASIIVTLIIVSLAPRYIKKEEMNLLSSCNEIDLNKIYTKSYLLGGSSIVAPQLLLTFGSFDWLYHALFITLGIAAYFDIKRNWIPDPVIFITLIINFLSIISSQNVDFYSTVSNSLFFIIPYCILNALSFLTMKKSIFYSGDIYIIISISFTIPPFVGFITTSLAIFSALLFMLISKKREIPFIPFLLFSFLLSNLVAY
ncbi:hypothetical protein [Enterobacter hormaechei]|uniref:hypothetical protein n=1 Tax=Enterobacter hormaechei TaxID=158836 RepID=UPI00350F08E2